MHWKDPLKAAFQLIALDYWNGWLYTLETSSARTPSEGLDCREIEDAAIIGAAIHRELAMHAGIRDTDTVLFGAWVDNELAAICWFQSRETHRKRRGLLPLEDDEAELAQITTASAFRGRGIASQLIRHGSGQMGAKGYRRLYAKIWRDNSPSRHAFERAGWCLQKRFISVRFRGVPRPLTVALPGRRRS